MLYLDNVKQVWSDNLKNFNKFPTSTASGSAQSSVHRPVASPSATYSREEREVLSRKRDPSQAAIRSKLIADEATRGKNPAGRSRERGTGRPNKASNLNTIAEEDPRPLAKDNDLPSPSKRPRTDVKAGGEENISEQKKMEKQLDNLNLRATDTGGTAMEAKADADAMELEDEAVFEASQLPSVIAQPVSLNAVGAGNSARTTTKDLSVPDLITNLEEKYPALKDDEYFVLLKEKLQL